MIGFIFAGAVLVAWISWAIYSHRAEKARTALRATAEEVHQRVIAAAIEDAEHEAKMAAVNQEIGRAERDLELARAEVAKHDAEIIDINRKLAALD